MQDWELDRIYIWVRLASIYKNDNGVKFLIDQKDKSLFNLIQKDKKWECVLNQEIAVRYSKEQIKILRKKIERIENNDILEFPKLSDEQIEHIQKAKLELDEKIKNKTEFDVMKYNEIIYGNPSDYGIEWIKNLGINIEELTRIGF